MTCEPTIAQDDMLWKSTIVSVQSECACAIACADVKFSCKFVNVQCKCVSEMHKRVEVRKQVCLRNCHMWVRCKMHVREWVLPLVWKHVMSMCGTKHAKKLRKFFCNSCEPITRGCNCVKPVCQQIVSSYPSAFADDTSDKDLCISFEHIQSVSLDT